MNVIVAAEESAGLQMLRALARGAHRVVAVLAAPPKPGFAGASVWNVARNLGFETWSAELVKDPALAGRLRSAQVDILLNVHSLYVIDRQVLAAPRLGAYNLHPGPLPRYAGLNAVSWALYRGERTHGVTVHKMDPEIDAGPIVYQSIFPIADDDTALSLSFKCVREGVALMLRLLEAVEADPTKIPLIAQDVSAREYFGREVPEQGRLSWSWPASKVVNFVRACDYSPFPSPWGYPRTRINAQELALVKARRTAQPSNVDPGTVGSSDACGVHVACRDEWVLVGKLLVAGKYVAAGEILKSGDRLTDL